MSGNYFKVKTGRSLNDRQAFGEIYLVNDDGTPWSPDNPADIAAQVVQAGPVRDALGGLYGRVLVSDGTSNQTARVQAALDASAGSHLTLVGDFSLPEDSMLVMKSNTTLVLRGAGSRIYVPDNTLPIIRNERAVFDTVAPTSGAGLNRDSNIHVMGLRGGVVESGAGAGAGHRIFFHQVDNVSVRDLRIVTANGKYAVLFADCTRFEAVNIDLSTYSDGVHVTGPCRKGRIQNITGTTGDDSVSLTGYDYDAYNYSNGSIEDVVIEDVRTTTSARAVLVTGAAVASATGTIYMRQITMRNIRASATDGIRISANTLSDAATIVLDQVLIDGVSNDQAGGQGLVDIFGSKAGSYAGTITLRNLSLPKETTFTAGSTRRYGVRCQAIDVRELNVHLTATDVGTRETRGVFLDGAAYVRNLNIDARSDFDITNSDVVHMSLTSRVGTLALRGSFKGGRVLVTDGSAYPDKVIAAGRHEGASSGFRFTVATPSTSITFQGWQAAGSAAVACVSSTAAMTLNLDGDVSSDQAGGAVAVTNATLQTVYSRSPGVRANLATLGKTADSVANNTNAALACGVGPAVSNGTNWKNIYSGAIY